MINRKVKVILLAVVMALCLGAAGCRGGDGGERIIVAGSTSVQPYAELLEEAFEEKKAEETGASIKIDIQGGGSAAGITSVENGAADIGMSSRELKDAEKVQMKYIVEIAKDGLAVIVHPSNPVANLTLEQIQKIYTKEITNWGEIGGNDASIHVITREEGSGTRSAFEELAMSKDHEISPKCIVQSSNGTVRLLVSDDPNSIGFISLGLIEAHEGQKAVKAVKLESIDATAENVKNGTYKLSRPFLFVSKENPTGQAKDFIDFIFSEHGKELLTKEGLII
jgi:phosphate binding protein